MVCQVFVRMNLVNCGPGWRFRRGRPETRERGCGSERTALRIGKALGWFLRVACLTARLCNDCVMHGISSMGMMDYLKILFVFRYMCVF